MSFVEMLIGRERLTGLGFLCTRLKLNKEIKSF